MKINLLAWREKQIIKRKKQLFWTAIIGLFSTIIIIFLWHCLITKKINKEILRSKTLTDQLRTPITLSHNACLISIYLSAI